MWPGFEPAKGTFDQKYLAAALSLVQSAAQYNITTLLDAHQDCLAETYCGEGAPAWAVTLEGAKDEEGFPMPFAAPFASSNTTHMPTPDECAKLSWSLYQGTFAGAAAYQQLYDSVSTNPNGAREEFALFWGTAAAAFKGVDSVVGIELLNEPFAGNFWKDPALGLPWVADQKNLQPFYDVVAAAVHAADPDRLVFFEPVTWSDQPIVNNATVGFTHAPGGDANALTSVLSFHYYSAPNFGNTTDYMERRLKAAKDLGVGQMVTEFDNGVGDYPAAVATMDIMDSLLLSWITWEYKPLAGSQPNGTCTGCGRGPWLPNGTLDLAEVATLSRTYAQAVAGVTQSMAFDSSSKLFTLVFAPSASITAPTEIYLNEAVHYPSGFTCTVSPASDASCTHVGPNSLHVVASTGASLLTVTISPS